MAKHRLVPLAVGTNKATVWVGSFRESDPPTDLNLEWTEEGTGQITTKALSGTWTRGSAGPVGERQPRFKRVKMSSLKPGTVYRLKLTRPGRTKALASGRLETLPHSLPSDSEERGFTVMLGSCYDYLHDLDHQGKPGAVRRAYRALYGDPAKRPHVKFLVGDQVYLDLPGKSIFGLFINLTAKARRKKLRTRMSLKYENTWKRLGYLLSRGGTFFTADDHEYYNNYPNPSKNLIPLKHPGNRADYEKISQRLYRNMQSNALIQTFNIGNQVSFMLVDTRTGRTAGRFLPSGEMNQLLAWINGLTCPSVLTLGQPVLDVPGTQEMHLPDFNQQFTRLEKALVNAPHDVLVLTGDKHYGRIASVARVGSQGSNGTLHEVMSSPMALSADPFDLPFTGALWIPGINKKPKRFPRGPRDFSRGAPVHYHHIVRARDYTPPRTEENFFTLAFSILPNGRDVNVRIRAWLPRLKPRRGSLPVKDFVTDIVLR